MKKLPVLMCAALIACLPCAARDKATIFIPGVNKGGSMQFGGGTTGMGAAEIF